MKKEFKGSDAYVGFNDEGIVFHYIGGIGDEEHVFLPYGSIEYIKASTSFLSGGLHINADGRKYFYPSVSKVERLELQKCVDSVKEIIVNARLSKPIEIDKAQTIENLSIGKIEYVSQEKIEKNVNSIKNSLEKLADEHEKEYNVAFGGLSELLVSMSEEEEILSAFKSLFLKKNHGTETSACWVINILTNKKYYYVGTDGASFGSQNRVKLGNVELKNVHALTSGTRGFIKDDYVAFETKNDDYEVVLSTTMKMKSAMRIKPLFEEALNKAKESKDTENKTQIAFSAADELKKFKELLDLGIINEDEFNAKKKQLLGL